MQSEHPTAFISYTRESIEQDERVLELAQSLRSSGIDCMIDQFVDPPDWVVWMEQQIRRTSWIMVVATETYLRRANDDERPDVGLSASWEYAGIRMILYGSRRGDLKVVPIVFCDEDAKYIPDALLGRSWYNVSDHATRHRLMLKLAGLPITVTPAPLGDLPVAAGTVSLASTVEFAQPKRDISPLRTIRVTVTGENTAPISGATVTAVAENGTTSGSSTAANGVATLAVLDEMGYTILFAHEKFEGAQRSVADVVSNGSIVLRAKGRTGSVVGVGGTTHIPGLNGRLNPILDTEGRLYLYADNISINGSSLQPATFQLDQALELQDAVGSRFVVTVRYIHGRAFLLDYVRPTR